MADTPALLPLLPPASAYETTHADTRFPEASGAAHYPVLIPNMRGLDSLLALEQDRKEKGQERLTDEIAVFVSSTEVFGHIPYYRSRLINRRSRKRTTVPRSTRSCRLCPL